MKSNGVKKLVEGKRYILSGRVVYCYEINESIGTVKFLLHKRGVKLCEPILGYDTYWHLDIGLVYKDIRELLTKDYPNSKLFRELYPDGCEYKGFWRVGL